MAVIVYSDTDARPIEDQISFGGRPFDLQTFDVKFRMRPANSDTLKVDSFAAVDNSANGKVSYLWDNDDLDTQGEFKAWWHVDTGDGNFDTEEFDVIVTKHAPGIRTRTGAFYEQAKSHLPITWPRLEEVLGDRVLQDQVEIVKKQIFSDDILVEDEVDYDIRIQSYIGKLVAIQVIPRAVDYWMNQHQTLSATGTNENVSFPDRVDALWKLYERLLRDVAADKPEIEVLIGVPSIAPLTSVPGLSGGTDEGFVTPLAQDYIQDYHFRRGKRRFSTRW